MLKIIVLFVFLCSSAPEIHSAFVDPQAKFTEWTGWGTSLAWFSDALGGLNQDVQDEMNYALFSPEKLNLNVLRYVIGGTTPGDVTCGPFRFGAATESFRDGPNEPYKWDRDPRGRKVLLAAKALGADVFEAFSNSPPSWLTRNGCTKGTESGAPLHDNFDPENADAFADYLTEVVKYYHENYGVTFTSLAPFNEPSSGYWQGTGSSQEGCNMERATMVEVIKSAYASLQAKNLTFCGLSVADETEINQELLTQRVFTDAGVAGMYTKVNTHGYSDNGQENRGPLFTLAQKNGHILWMDEVGWSRSDLEDMRQGLSLAERIVYDVRNMVPSAWVYWQAVEDQQPGMWGLLDVPYSDATIEKIHYNSGYYAMMQFSKYITRGFTIVHVNDGNSVAAYNEMSQTLVLVVVNSASNVVTNQFDLTTFSSLGEMEAFRTSPSEPHVPITPPSLSGNQFDFSFPAKSVTTFKMSGSIAKVASNLVTNGDFESGRQDAWFLLYGQRQDSAINGNYVRRGSFSGYVDFNESELSLMQNVTVRETKRYYLTAWCASSGENTKFGALVNGQQGPELTITSWAGYQVYGLSIDAAASDVISIYVYAQKGNYNAQIDDVELH
ncbi:Endo-beta-1,6-galactanase [Orchesella cincta]|uniref:Endo-beta-1,6-galactanase n=1 Tax=Orchesella cincta TaxID=48709 RepID=A0A1D2N6Y5_ORCCI|nr:Endo-beta-1,6-galactanase [Orchesella cincta]